MDKWTPIPNACNANQFEKCPHGMNKYKSCIKIHSCKDYIPIYSWRELSDSYTCSRCFNSCDWMGCPICNPEGYREAVESMYYSDTPKDKTYYDLIDEPNRYKSARIKYFILWSLRKILPIRISDYLYYIF